jgi:hypothetical protein
MEYIKGPKNILTITLRKYGLLPEKEAKAMPRNRLCIDLIGPYNINSNIRELRYLL